MLVLNDYPYDQFQPDNFWNTTAMKTNSTIQTISNQSYSNKKILKYNSNRLNIQYNNEKAKKTKKNSRNPR